MMVNVYVGRCEQRLQLPMGSMRVGLPTLPTRGPASGYYGRLVQDAGDVTPVTLMATYRPHSL